MWCARELARTLLLALLLGLFTRTFLFQVVRIPSESMAGTLLPGDFVLVNKLLYAGGSSPLLPTREPRRWDVTVFRSPENHSLLAKRLLGLPGEMIEHRSGQLLIDESPLDERAYARPNSARSSGSSSRLMIPARHYYALGDNRPKSHDSRSWGAVSRERIRGRILLVLWSTSFAPDRGTQKGFWGRLLGSLDVVRFLLEGRYERFLKPVH